MLDALNASADLAGLFGRIVAGILLVLAGLLKVASGPSEVARGLRNLVLVPRPAVPGLVVALPAVELLLGGALVLGLVTPAVVTTAVGLYLGFLTVQAGQVRSQAPPCPCFGRLSRRAGHASLLVTALGLVSLAAVALTTLQGLARNVIVTAAVAGAFASCSLAAVGAARRLLFSAGP